jgi:proteic killer suppression protein
MIKSFKHKGLEKFYSTGSKAGIIPSHAEKLRDLLFVLDDAERPGDMDIAGWGLHPLRGSLEGHWAVKVNGNWRLTFRFIEDEPEVVDYQDYH